MHAEVADAEGPPEAPEKQNWFVNAAVEIRTTLLPRDLLSAMQDIEQAMGRVRTYRGAPRVIDLDLLLYGQNIIREADLTVPHPELHKRLFVLAPLCEIASYVLHPVFGVSMRGLKDRLEDFRTVERLTLK
jgi:2-amino-4-hydroxy-6-hydroxymethyldihydropteridine diphosphokinase